MKKSRAKYPVGSVIKHKTMGYIAKITERGYDYVELEVLKGKTTNVPYYNQGFREEGKVEIVVYSPNSINRIFEDLGPSAKILYGKD